MPRSKRVMKKCCLAFSLTLSVLCGVAPATAQDHEAEAGPTIDLPTDLAVTEEANDSLAGLDPNRGMQEMRMSQGTGLGGYGELHFNLDMPEGAGANETQLDLHRLVFFFHHQFTDSIRFYSEVEVEHAFVAGEDSPGEIGVEQAFIDWELIENALTLRAGIVLVPMGMVNEWHEPPIFNGVERPNVDKYIIPSTWREGGIGIVGEPTEGLRYQLYLTGGLDVRGFSAGSGLRGGRQHVAKALASSPAISGRVEYEPILGMVVGASGYYGMAGANSDLDLDVSVLGVSADARYRRNGIEARAMVAHFSIGDTEGLRTPDADGDILSDVGSATLGAYGEVGYNVLQSTDSEQALVPFFRYEYYDTTLGEDDAAFNRPAITEYVMGLHYRPIPQVSFKADFILRRPDEGEGENSLNLGVGWMF